jgi:hypothetical protein
MDQFGRVLCVHGSVWSSFVCGQTVVLVLVDYMNGLVWPSSREENDVHAA